MEMDKVDGPKPAEKKPVKKRKSWGQELPTPKTNLPPRKRAKTEDEKEQRRIERVLRNRAAAQISRERKRLEIEKLEGEKLKIEQQNEFLLRRLSQMEEENSRLSQQVAKLASEIQTSKSRPGSPAATTASTHTAITSTSPTLAPVLFKQENDLISGDKMDSIPDHLNPSTSAATTTTQTFSPSLLALSPADFDRSSASASDMTQHPAAVLCDLQCQSEAPAWMSLTSTSTSTYLSFMNMIIEPDLSFLEDGLSLGLLPGSDDDNLHRQHDEFDDSIGFPEQTPLPASSLQPSFGASLERCDEQGIAAGAE
ncbi:hypothetical protein FQN49_008339 [Arthroderma sp. PD_2]|nr:hypothetical protein FQN49_008339 [Arthroderma sp. PD_2]